MPHLRLPDIGRKIDQRMRKLDKLKKLIESDPEIVDLFVELISVNGTNGNAFTNQIRPKAPKAAKEAPTEASVGAPQQSEQRNETKRGELLAAALEIVSRFSGAFSSRDLLKALKNGGYVFAAKKESVAISGVLKRLQKREVIKRADDMSSKTKALYVYAK